MGIITMIIIGLIAGAIARLLVPGKENFGWILTIVLGIVGGYVGGTLGSLVFAPHKFSVHPPVQHTFRDCRCSGGSDLGPMSRA
ncbi:GlsB/YeaQ/YmgE family stress response membrane protein [Nocardia nova]|uniref:GlsB/YeaQ/YmgE family stress response membrane protein n=1 Tax=Nocardia TaxID=1817 RepID=UPI000AC7FFF8|nr:GlsB/YeaQ/YmgE family stress response membrane protein [Nocardia nova]MBF6278485.1 GlsB/YeaQ/YmgE family stress response membrane protein [Nocardia nova]